MRKGTKHNKETKKKMSENHADVSGINNPRFGKHFSKETILKMSLTRKGRHFSPNTEFKKGQFIGDKSPFYGKKRPELSKIMKENNPMKGKHLSEETKKKISLALKGENHPLWRGGISFEPYTLDWTNTLRIAIRERDKYTCQMCGRLQGDVAFCVHHIDYNKNNCNLNNLITLCRNCHAKTNVNRNKWGEYFNKKDV